jgi:hypothetical protein
LQQNVFTWVDLNQILESLKLTHEQFVDAALLAGLPNFEMPTFPPIDERNFSFKGHYLSTVQSLVQSTLNDLSSSSSSSSLNDDVFLAAYDLVSTFKSGYAAIQNSVNTKVTILILQTTNTSISQFLFFLVSN